MFKLIPISILLFNFLSSQKVKDRLIHFNSSRNQTKILDFSQYKDSIVNFESIGPKNIQIQNYATQGLGRINDVLLFNNNVERILVASAAGGLWESTNAGKNWNNIKTNFGNFGVSKIYEINDTIWILTGDSELPNISNSYSIGLLYSVDNLKTFNRITFPESENLLLTSLIKFNDNIYCTTNKGIFLINESIPVPIFNNENEFYRSLTVFKNEIYFSYTTKDSNGIYRYNDTENIFEKIYSSDKSRLEIRYSDTDPENIYIIESSKDLSNFNLFKYDGSSFKNIIENNPILTNQLDYNLELCISPYSKDVIFIGGVTLYYSSDNLNTLAKVNNIHVDVHRVKFHPLTNEIFLCTDGGLFKLSSDFKETDFLSQGMSISQIFDFDVNPNNENLISAGLMDNGSIFYNGNNWQFIGSGDGMSQQFIDDTTLFTSYQRGAIFYHNLNKSNSNLISSDIITDFNTPFYTSFYIYNNKIYYFNNNIIIKDLDNNNIEEIKVSESLITSFVFFNNKVYLGTSAGNIYEFNLLNNNFVSILNLESYISDIKIYNNDLYISSSNHQKPFYSKYNLNDKSYKVLNNEIPVNSFELIDSISYLGTDKGILILIINTNEIINLKNNEIDLGVITKIKHHKKSNKLFISTFSNGLYCLNLNNNCKINEPVISQSDTLYKCFDEQITLNIENFNSELSYIWSTNDENDSLLVSKEGIYYVTSTNGSCNLTSKPIYVKNFPLDEINLSLPEGNEVCDGDSITILIDSKYKNVIWNNNKTTNQIKVTKGIYWAEILNENNCKITTDTIEIYSHPLPQTPFISKNSNRLETTKNVDWYLNDTLIALNQSFVDLLKYGTYYCTNKNEKCISYSENFIYEPLNNFKLFPNPANDIIIVELLFNKEIKISLEISDLKGKIVYNQEIDLTPKPFFNEIDISSFSKGTYIVNVISNNKVLSQKFIKI